MFDPTITRIAILVNPRAGKGRAGRVLEQILSLIKDIDHKVFQSEWPLDLSDFSDVFLIGGDGTLNFLINRYPSLKIPITLFKGGSGNDFAWKLYGNRSVREHFLLALKNKPRLVDAGRCNGKMFVNGVGIGFDGSIVKSMGEKRFISAGYIAYLYTVLKHLLFYREFDVSINNKESRVFMLTIANGSRYGGGFMVAPDAVIDDGFLDFMSISPINPLKRMFYLPFISSGKHTNLSIVHSLRTKGITVKTKEKVSAHCDGELLIDEQFDIQILPGHFLFRS